MPDTVHSNDIFSMRAFLQKHPRVVVITGAGLSAESGIPTYRDAQGNWLRREPIQHQRFIQELSERQRYWARSMLGWKLVSASQANSAHKSLARWEQEGRIELLISQNVDGLHRKAGSNNVLNLHGRLDRVQCLNCYHIAQREDVQSQLISDNPELWHYVRHAGIDAGPDGDANVDDWDMSQVRCPVCPACGQEALKPDVVFFGGTVPKARVELAKAAIRKADALLIIGSSLMVFSGFRFCKYAQEMNKPMAAINLGMTRADELLDLKLDMDIGEALKAL
ncbi:NAD-dependent protein deacetylase [Pseudoteredinibacter isoporae]|nr:NAD-dependent protein deacetylase [Pseudoteredinibacter isoporae]NHO85654.1 NAD-dependent protein deacetylase [Pseudoteredinibacter isoporae]NIB25894.1 NAD-dependent protein deacetylase [Pseudoteredinibacter isoporae]